MLRKTLLLLCGPSLALAQSAEEVQFFETRIRPVLAEKCFGCHSSKLPKPMAQLNLSTAAGFWKGSESGPIAIKGDAENSRLIKVLQYQGSIKMPPSGKLKEHELADFVEWVKMGAQWPDSAPTPTLITKAGEYQFTKEQRDFWSFQPVRDYPVPKVRKQDWPRTPIDHFILAKLEEKGLAPAPPAERLALLRRATFDLTGLPPAPPEIDAFLSDDSSGAFTKVVERLLASPRYGERWGRHWLDVARYADSNGTDYDIKYPYSYRYVDYVIEAFNSDLRYDQFVKEQLAGDLLPSPKPGQPNVRGIIGTGFLALGPKPLTERNRVKMFYDVVDEQLSTTAAAFMGLTVGCARCHDHKFDPIPTKDYYSLASIFANTKSLSKLESEDGGRALLYFVPLEPKESQERYESHQRKIASKSAEIDLLLSRERNQYVTALLPQLARYMVASHSREDAGLDPSVVRRWTEYLKPSKEFKPYLDRWRKAVSGGPEEIAAAARMYENEFKASAAEWQKKFEVWQQQTAGAIGSGKDPPSKPSLLDPKDLFFNDVMFSKGAPFALQESKQLGVLRAELDLLKKSSPPMPAMACGVTDGPEVKQRVFIRGSADNPGEEAPKQFPRILAGDHQKPIATGSGRRELAEWLADPSHPLTARVMVNRLWQYHFGYGLVRTPNNFGKMGEAPTHPELLDYLAKRFVESGWSVKSMHRLIMLSGAYQMSSLATRQQIDVDPDNRLLSHFNRRRLDAEEIRDGLLAIDGSIDLTMGGSPQTDTGVEDTAGARRGIDLTPLKRRTVYLPIRRANLPGLMTLFDFGDATTPGEGRTRTNIAPQALFMMNSQFISDRSRGLARKLLAQESGDPARIESAYRLVVGRAPEAEEMERWIRYLQSFRNKVLDSRVKVDNPELYTWQSIARILMASNEFMYVD